jgi:hypothetical protein
MPLIEQHENRIPDLILNSCPIRCNDCKGIYFNHQIRHRIICKCPCHQLMEEKGEEKRLQSASLVVSPERRAALTSTTTLGEDAIGR